eukprot:COSAG05_NODE_986_length_6286_cov_3.404881_3_plen_97_part_00
MTTSTLCANAYLPTEIDIAEVGHVITYSAAASSYFQPAAAAGGGKSSTNVLLVRLYCSQVQEPRMPLEQYFCHAVFGGAGGGGGRVVLPPPSICMH